MKAIKTLKIEKQLTVLLSMLLFLFLNADLYSQHPVSKHGNPNAAAYTIPSSQIGYEVILSNPVPFNANTFISYSIPVPMEVEIKLFDNIGRELQVLVNEIQQAGTHKISLADSNLNDGVYFYMLSIGNYSEVKKITLKN
ncbi:MAG: T9SS type A sorting domain-containing protein [Chlorobi bacterium]|nr:T9SS type A sorting domain-containing protein [Chlorobiota bacterium]MCI0715257.1 T9SS type A sorting domain-containing protein [Chlorobiota bacterium]